MKLYQETVNIRLAYIKILNFKKESRFLSSYVQYIGINVIIRIKLDYNFIYICYLLYKANSETTMQ